MNAFIFVVEAVIGAGACTSAEKIRHFVLIELGTANVFLVFFVVIVKLTAFAVTLIFHKASPLTHVFQPVKAVLQNYLSGQRVDDLLALFSLGVGFVKVS